jgi:Site-specific recombinase XerD
MKIRKADINGSQGWCLDYGKRDGKRRRVYFHSEQEAKKALRDAEKEAVAVGRRWAYLAAEQRADVVAILGEIDAAGLTLRKVWDGFRNGAAVPVESKPLSVAITELVKTKITANRRPAYVASLEQYLCRWSKGQETKPVAAVKLEEIEAFLNGLPSMSSRATAINRLSTLFSFAVRRGWRTDNPCRRLERPHVENGTPSILTVDEAKKVLQFTRAKMPRFLPWLTLALFAGIRPEEADKMTWEAIDLDRGIAKVDALTAKVRNRRNVHLKPVAIEWLRKGGDLPLPHVTRRRCLRKLRDVLGWPVWKKDVLRHSAASYWLASDPDAPRIAMELGNSPGVLFKHYRELVSDEQAKQFWALTPKKVGRK